MLTATPDGAGGWRVSGHIPWLTGWGLVDAVLLGASTPDRRILFALLSSAELADAGTVRPHDLWSMNATYAVSVRVTELRVAPPQIVSLRPVAPWLRDHHTQSANAHPALFGNLHATTAFLGAHPPFTTRAAHATRRAAELRTRAYALTDGQPPTEALAERLAVRAAAVDLALRTATACVIASGAQAMTRAATAARLLAEASFHAVHGQNTEARQAYARDTNGTVRQEG
ncbi:hypothetical protein ACPA54_28900 [Uniformispora flossi]|uniref:hypothetical protein n=1 Tax=Uniformispora flossi TaxID=3390723 RepID=UPI003C2BC868